VPAILFVCTANRFRSPLAGACFQKELTAHGLGDDWQISSAGTWATNGLPATKDAVNAALRFGFDIRNHRSRVVNAELIENADIVIVMEQGHKEALCTEFPESARKVHLLSEAATGMPYDVPDPGLSPVETDVDSEMAELIHAGFDRICGMARKS
jgi:protein arginine phosphatase